MMTFFYLMWAVAAALVASAVWHERKLDNYEWFKFMEGIYNAPDNRAPGRIYDAATGKALSDAGPEARISIHVHGPVLDTRLPVPVHNSVTTATLPGLVHLANAEAGLRRPHGR